MNKKRNILFASLMLIVPMVVSAQSQLAEPPLPIQGGVTSIWTVFINVLGWLWPLFVGVTILMLIYAGLMFVTSNGEASKISSARHAVTWAVVGIIVAILAFSAYDIIKTVIQPAVGACTVPVMPPADATTPPPAGPCFIKTQAQCTALEGTWVNGAQCP